ncbi:VOC family protein [Nocardia sp. NPDC020380]|uniref:VOC family protein n=1 Tax=Nocardia sp. NPDC020380 TaxID=3364309 RepID=UPI0037B116F8
MQLDHVFCLVDPADDWAERLAAAGLEPDAGMRHAGQGTRNRRLHIGSLFLELLWVCDKAEAQHNPLRLDRRADWVRSGASPFGVGLRGSLPGELAGSYWQYTDLGFPIWVPRDDQDAPERPLIFILDSPARPVGTLSRPAVSIAADPIHSVRIGTTSIADIPPYEGPAIIQETGAARLEVFRTGGPDVFITDILALRNADSPADR